MKPASPRLVLAPDGLAVVSFDDPVRRVNVLDEAVLRTLSDLLERLQQKAETGEVRAVLFASAKPDAFIVGADLEAIAAIESPEAGAEGARAGQAVFLALERLPVPTVAAIHGTCLGGGLELALACDVRIASGAKGTKMGFPEVRLGILPAWGGTTRAPRLVGLEAALDLLLSGREVDARKALRMGLVDTVVPAEGFADSAHRILEEVAAGSPPRSAAKRTVRTRLLEGTPVGRAILFRAAEKRVRRETGGHYPAPLRILDVVRRSRGRPLETALDEEARAAGELLVTPVSRNLLHLFHLQEAARKGRHVPGLDAAPRVDALGVVGAGVMGGGLAQLAAWREVRVQLRDVREEALAVALRHAHDRFASAAARRRITASEARRGMDRIAASLDLHGFGTVAFVVEAVVERLEVKQKVFRELETRVPDACVLATNTSSLLVDRIADALERPERLVGLHFFNPVHRMPLVEVVQGPRSDPAAVAAAYAFALRLGKTPVLVRDGPGFLVNRILGVYLNEAGHLLAEGASIEAIDEAAVRFGMPMGPLRLMDEVGLDIVGHAGASLHEALGDRLAPAPPLVHLGEAGDRQGRKGGRGIYRYVDGQASGVDPEARTAMGLSDAPDPSAPTSEAIRDRLVLGMINEAARILEEGLVPTAGDVDLAMILGAGFPPFRGGLLRLADERHPRALVERLRELEKGGAGRFAPAPLLLRLAEEDRGFHEAFPPHG